MSERREPSPRRYDSLCRPSMAEGTASPERSLQAGHTNGRRTLEGSREQRMGFVSTLSVDVGTVQLPLLRLDRRPQWNLSAHERVGNQPHYKAGDCKRVARVRSRIDE